MSFFSKNEVIALIVASLVIGYVLAFKQFSWILWASYVGMAALIVLTHHIGCKVSASLFDCSVETQLWTMKQFALITKAHFKKPFPIWLFVPLILVWLSFGFITWIGILTFNIIPLPSRVKMRWRELTEWHIALVAVGGLFFNIILAVISKSLGFDSFAYYNLLFVFFSLVPIGQLSGAKIFFGSIFLWIFFTVFSVIMLLLIQALSPLYTVISAICIAVFAIIAFYMYYSAS
jgi:hypothetical protein